MRSPVPLLRSMHADTPRVVADRYELGEVLGRGGASTVYAATDRLSGRAVALKSVRIGGGVNLARARLEIAILRRVQRPELLPGVVRLLDDGGDERHVWLAMERVDGRPFPGRAIPCGWTELRATTLSLLETLSELHAAGVVHRDLKPDNVLVGPHGQPIVVDFGIAAAGDAFEEGVTASREVHGTRDYLAPERLHGRAGPAADLYSVGVMLERALGEAPDEVRAVVRALVDGRPERRPPSARAALEALRGSGAAPPARLSLGAPPDAPRWMPQALRARFAGPDRLLHLASDGAAALLRTTGGEPARVDAELARLVHARLATFDGERVAMRRAALDALDDARRTRTKRRQTPRAWLARARRHAERGQLALAERLLRDALRAAAAQPRDERLLHRAAGLWVQLVLSARDRGVTARFTYELSRIDAKPPSLAGIEALARAWDEAIRWTPDALERARAVPPLDGELDVLRFDVRVFAARKVSVEALREEVAATERASRSRAARWERCRAVARGRLAYVEERYDDAARWHATATARSPWRTARLDALLNAASAEMEAFRFERAIALASEARVEARAARLAFFEGRAEWIARSAADRAGHALAPDLELVRAAQHLDAPDLVLLLAVTEATLAFRIEDRALFVALAEMAADACGLHNEMLGMATVRAMEIALGLRAAEERDRALPDRLAERGVPRLALEVAALIEGDAARSQVRSRWLAGLARSVPRRLQGHRLGVLSVRECMARLGLDETTTRATSARGKGRDT